MRPGFFGNLGDTWFGELGRHGGRGRGHHKGARKDHPRAHDEHPRAARHPGKHKGWEKGKHHGWKKDKQRKGWKKWRHNHPEAFALMQQEGPCAALRGRQQARCMKQLWRAYKEAKIQAAAPAPGPLSGFFGFFGL